MPSEQQHTCTVHAKADGAPYLAFEPLGGEHPAYSNSHFTLDLRPGVTMKMAEELASRINEQLLGVSSTIF